MNTRRTEEFRVHLSNGLVIDRLPVGLANGQWHLAFVCSGVNFVQGSPPRHVRFAQEFRDTVTIAAVAGSLDYQGGGVSGGWDEQEVRMRYVQNDLTGLVVTYLDGGNTAATEVIDLMK